MSYKKNMAKKSVKVIGATVLLFAAIITAVFTTSSDSKKLEHSVVETFVSTTSERVVLCCNASAVSTTTTNVSATSSSVTKVTTIPVTTVTTVPVTTTVTTTTVTDKEDPEMIPVAEPEPVVEDTYVDPVVEEEPYYEPEPEPEPVYDEPEYYEPSSDGLTCIGSFSRGTFYTGSYGGSGRALMDCAYGGDGEVKGSIASYYLWRTYGYNYNGERTKVYLEVTGYPSMSGWYSLDDCSANYGYYGGMVDSSGYSYSGWIDPDEVIDFAYYYNSNCQFYGQGVVHVTAYVK